MAHITQVFRRVADSFADYTITGYLFVIGVVIWAFVFPVLFG